MLGYKKSPTSTNKSTVFMNEDNESGIETAHKSSYQEYSPSRVISAGLKSPSQSHISNRIQEAKSTIDSIIDEVQAKRILNREGV